MAEKRDPILDFLKNLGEVIDSTRDEFFMDHGDAMEVIDTIDEMYTDLKAKLKKNAEEKIGRCPVCDTKMDTRFCNVCGFIGPGKGF